MDSSDGEGDETEEVVDWKGSKAYKRYVKICRSDADALHNYVSFYCKFVE